jgi:hypothetical protein
MGFISFLKEHTPWPIRRLSRKIKRLVSQPSQAKRSTREVFTHIYAENVWGRGLKCPEAGYDLYSGPGSEAGAAQLYVDCVKAFIVANGIRSVVDLGCGDFRVGSKIATNEIDYIGADIVEFVVHANEERFGGSRVRFVCLDIIEDDLPGGELCLIREVLQHLSNVQIEKIIKKLSKYKWIIVSEVHPGPVGSFKPNRDKPHGADSRILWNSGVVLDAPPFNVKNVALLLSVLAVQSEGDPIRACISSFLIRN